MVCNCSNTNDIKITQGCSKILDFNFDSDIEGYNAQFVVKADIDSNPILTKTISDLSGMSFTLDLTPTDTGVFVFEDYAKQYIWGLDLYNDNERLAIFPKTGDSPCNFIVYRHIGE